MKINRSQIARELDIDRRTVDKYINGYEKPTSRFSINCIEPYYDIISELLSDNNQQIFYYRKVLWQYLVDNHNYTGVYCNFAAYLRRYPEFDSYFSKNRPANKEGVTIRYETDMGKQDQLDWKESIPFILNTGEAIEVNIFDFKEKNASRSMIKAAAFPFVKEIRDYDFSFQPSVNEQEINELCTLSFLEKHENIVFLGPSGVGKTHLATSIGIAAAKRRVSTYFVKCNDLLSQLKRAKLENRLDARLKHFSKYKLLIIDEIGYLPINKEDSNLFFQLIDMRYEKLTTNMNFNEWDGIFFDAVVANAIMDRVLHHARVVTISGRSYRLKDHIKSKD